MDRVNPTVVDLMNPGISGLVELIDHINSLIKELPTRERLGQDNDYGVPVIRTAGNRGNGSGAVANGAVENGPGNAHANGHGNDDGDGTMEDDPDPWPARPTDPVTSGSMGPPGHQPGQGYNAHLFYTVATQVTDANRNVLAGAMLPQLVTVLRLGHRDPQPALDLIQKLMKDLHLNDILNLANEDEIVQLLSSPHTGLNMLGLDIVHKARKNSLDCAHLASTEFLFSETINTWIMNENTTVGTKATHLLGDILEMDCASKVSMKGHPSMLLKQTDVDPGELDRNGYGAVWLRMWEVDPPRQGIMGIIRSATRLDPHGPDQEISESEYRDASIAQGRLMDLLPRLVNLEPMMVLRSNLFNHAITTMIRRGDIIMAMTFNEFLKRLVTLAHVSPKRTAEVDEEMGSVIRTACQDEEMKSSLLMLPNTIVEEEAVPLRNYVNMLLGG